MGNYSLGRRVFFSGYYHDEAATRSVVNDDGWFSTGDIAEKDADGYWYITGRKKELIVSSNGKKIYPARIEGSVQDGAGSKSGDANRRQEAIHDGDHDTKHRQSEEL